MLNINTTMTSFSSSLPIAERPRKKQGLSVLLAGITLFAMVFFCASVHANDHKQKRIALSFDDAPRGQGPMFSGEERTAQLIKSLEQAQTGPTVFFVLTKHLDKKANQTRIERYSNAGHLIANHSHQHPWLHKTDTSEYILGIDQAETLLQGYPNRRPWYRFPYLDEGRTLEKRDALSSALAKRKLLNAYVTVDNYDWYIESKWQQAVDQGKQVDLDALRDAYVHMLTSAVTFYDNVASKALEQSPAHMLLLHENDLAALFIGDLVAKLREQGWQIIHPDRVYVDPIAKLEPKTLITGQGRVAALAVDAGINPRTLTHLSIEEDQIDQLLLDKKVFSSLGK